MKRRIQPHLRVGEGDVEDIVIITGNPDRVSVIAGKMNDSTEIARYRGFVTYRAYTPGGVPVTISGTGIGTPSTHICIEELARLGAKVILRLGSCGGIDYSVKTGDVVIPTGCVRDDRTSRNYAPIEYPAVASVRWFNALNSAIHKALPADRIHTGICWTSDVYYSTPENNPLELWTRARVKCVEMESALLFVFATTHGIDAASILSVDGNLHGNQKGEQADETEQTGEQHPLLKEAIDRCIDATLAAIDQIKSSS